MKRALVSTLAFLLAAGACATAAEAQQRSARIREGARPEHSMRLEAHGTVAWHGSFGVGGRFEIPIVKEGFIDGVDDELALSPGFDLLFAHVGDQASTVIPIALVAVQWSFWLSQSWSVFGEAGLATVFANWGPYHHRHQFHDEHGHAFFAPLLSLGGRLHLGDAFALAMRVSWPTGGQVGVVFHF